MRLRQICPIIASDYAVINMWIHEHRAWPNFSWDTETLATELASVRHSQGRLLGQIESFGFELKREASLNPVLNAGGGRSTSYRLPAREEVF